MSFARFSRFAYPRTRAAVALALIWSLSSPCGCRGDVSDAPAESVDTALLAQLESCAVGIERVQAASPDARARELVAFAPEGRACSAILLAGCAKRADDADVSTHTAACVQSHCARLEPRPALCDPESAASTDEPERLVAVLSEFLAAKLASDLKLPRDEPSVVHLAQAYASLWAAPLQMMQVAVSPPPQAQPSFRVGLEEDGTLTLTLELPPGEPEITLLPAGTSPTPGAQPVYDEEGLAEYARALGGRFPELDLVELSVANTVPMQALIEVMEVLREVGCEPPPAEDSRCLFPEVAMINRAP